MPGTAYPDSKVGLDDRTIGPFMRICIHCDHPYSINRRQIRGHGLAKSASRDSLSSAAGDSRSACILEWAAQAICKVYRPACRYLAFTDSEDEPNKIGIIGPALVCAGSARRPATAQQHWPCAVHHIGCAQRRQCVLVFSRDEHMSQAVRDGRTMYCT